MNKPEILSERLNVRFTRAERNFVRKLGKKSKKGDAEFVRYCVNFFKYQFEHNDSVKDIFDSLPVFEY